MTDKEKMLAGKLYIAQGEEIFGEMRRAKRLTRLFNATTEEEIERRTELLKTLFAETGEHIYIEPTFRCDYGSHIYVGENFYANYDCIILDVAPVRIGKNVLFGPRVCVYTAGHPVDQEVRGAMLEFGLPITIGDNAWVGGNTVINPGVTIGSGTVIGSGSVVTKDLPENVVAAGSPCRVLREISEADKAYWEEKRAEYLRT